MDRFISLLSNHWKKGIVAIFWLMAINLVIWAGYLVVEGESAPNLVQMKKGEHMTPTPEESQEKKIYPIPEFHPGSAPEPIIRAAHLDTIIPNQNRSEAITYIVEPYDSVFGIAEKFNLKPETILWSNYDVLQDNPHALMPEMELTIPPVDGIYYEWQEGDTIDDVAERFDTQPENLLNWTGNQLDLTNPTVEPGTHVMIPGGEREFQQWIIPTIARGSAGVSEGVYGGGVCPGSYQGVVGSGSFGWPTNSYYLSGNDYWSGHLAIDLGVKLGGPVFASDHGVVVFSGWARGGYGNVVIIDHGNGYQTLYAHLSQTSVGCGQSVSKGQVIGRGGSTGNSTGPHLHFEVRFQGGFVNPWIVLPGL
ncbi:MAG: peptidoglycan DD-metalloendopeptidase family protein [Anaerolineales bacterium]|nr:peptidoglycan DD-metalloendopeptidase family protein [Anaerolineales bacterium]